MSHVASHLVRPLLLLALLTLVSGCEENTPVSISTPPELLRFSTMAPARSHIVREVVQPFVDALNENGQGRVVVEHYPGPVLGKPNRQYDVVSQGVVDIAVVVVSYKPERFKRFGFLGIPYSYHSSASASTAIWQMIECGYFQKELDGLIPLSLWVSRPNAVHTDFPIDGPQSLHGKKIRVVSKYQALALENLGAVGVAMPITDAVEALRKGIVDGILSDYSAARAYGITESAKNHLSVPLGGTLMLIAMNEQRFLNLDEAAKKSIVEVSGLPQVKRMSALIDGYAGGILREFSSDTSRNISDTAPFDEVHSQDGFRSVEQAFVREIDDGQELLSVFSELLISQHLNST